MHEWLSLKYRILSLKTIKVLSLRAPFIEESLNNGELSHEAKELLLLGSALNNTFEHRNGESLKEKEVQMAGTERGSCLDEDTHTQNGR